MPPVQGAESNVPVLRAGSSDARKDESSLTELVAYPKANGDSARLVDPEYSKPVLVVDGENSGKVLAADSAASGGAAPKRPRLGMWKNLSKETNENAEKIIMA